jgi:hypothetical protein
MPVITLTEDQHRGLLLTLDCAKDDARDNGAGDRAQDIEDLMSAIGTPSPWSDDLVQFARLLAEILAVGIDDETMAALCQSMDLDECGIDELFERAERAWERFETVYAPRDFREQMADYLRRGLGPDEILERLDPDTAGVDLIELVKTLMADNRLCK